MLLGVPPAGYVSGCERWLVCWFDTPVQLGNIGRNPRIVAESRRTCDHDGCGFLAVGVLIYGISAVECRGDWGRSTSSSLLTMEFDRADATEYTTEGGRLTCLEELRELDAGKIDISVVDLVVGKAKALFAGRVPEEGDPTGGLLLVFGVGPMVVLWIPRVVEL